MDDSNKDSFDEIPDFLADLKKKRAGYRVPEDYFAKMRASVLDQVVVESEKPTISIFEQIIQKVQWLAQPKYAMMTVAACVLIVMTIGLQNSSDSIKPMDTWSSLSVDDYEYYFDSSIEEYDNLELMAVVSEDELIDQHMITPISTIEMPDMMVEEYIDGLDSDNLIEFQSIDE